MKYLIVLVAVIFYANFAYASEEVQSNNQKQGRTLDGGLTSGFTTALSSIGTIGILGIILIGILLAPTILSILFANPIMKRAFDDGLHMDKAEMLAKLAMIQEAWQKFDVKDPQCRKRFNCEVHALEPELGPTARNMVKFMDYVSNAGRFNLPGPILRVVKEYIESMKMGKEVKDCSRYSTCPYSIASHFRSQ